MASVQREFAQAFGKDSDSNNLTLMEQSDTKLAEASGDMTLGKRQCRNMSEGEELESAAKLSRTAQLPRGYRELLKFFHHEVHLAAKTESLTWTEYQEFLQLPRGLDLQLAMVGASEEELQKYPARTSWQDGQRYLPWLKASSSFREGTSQVAERSVDANAVKGVTRVRVNFEAGQEALNDIVVAIYARQINLGPHNIVTIMALADFLQADWLMKAILQHVQSEFHNYGRIRDPVGVFHIGLQFPVNLDLCRTVIAFSVTRRVQEVLQLLECSHTMNAELQTFFIQRLSEYKSLKQILQVMSVHESRGGWWLCNAHIDLLKGTFTEHGDILDCLKDETTTKPPSWADHKSRYQLALKLLSARGVQTLQWPLTIEWSDTVGGFISGKYLLSPEVMVPGPAHMLLTMVIVMREDGGWDVLVHRPMPHPCEFGSLTLTLSSEPERAFYHEMAGFEANGKLNLKRFQKAVDRFSRYDRTMMSP